MSGLSRAARQPFYPVNSSWKASHGFACAFAVILLSRAMDEGFRIGCRSSATFAGWVRVHSYFAEASFHVLLGCMWVSAAYLFGGLRGVNAFVREAGFAKKLTFSGWLCAWGAIGLALLDLYFVQKGWGEQSPSARRSYQSGQIVWITYLVQSTLLAPLIEETVSRGFLYHAFRGSYGPVLSTFLVLGFETYFHWGLVSRDLTALALLLAGGAILCVIREQTGNTWNCVLFHAAYNTTVVGQWPLSLVAMLIVWPLCEPSTRPLAPRTSEGAGGR
jgi:membrane protease YdiL (CAAX protease family)